MLRKNAKFSKTTISVKGLVSRWELRVGIHKATYNRYYNTVCYTKQDREVLCELNLENDCNIILRSFFEGHHTMASVCSISPSRTLFSSE